MLTILVQPVLEFMHLLHISTVFILTASFHIGRAIFLLLLQSCNIIIDIFTALFIVGEELYRFVCELNSSISTVSNYVRRSANGGINCVLEAFGLFLRHIVKFFANTRLHSKLLATQLGCSICDVLNLLRNALLLIADCAWWLITLLPRWLLYVVIAVGDFVVGSITAVRQSIIYTVEVVVEDIFRLTIGAVLLFLLWHNRMRICLTILKWSLKVKRVIILARLRLIAMGRRIFRHRVNQVFVTPTRVLRRSPLPRSSGDKLFEVTQRCVICRDRQKCVLLLPCKHLCLCDECADYLFFSAERKNCPLCRTDIDHWMSVYV